MNISNNTQPYNTKQKALITTTTALGVLGGMTLLARHNKQSLMKYWKHCTFDDVPVITIGASSCLGGLAGGCIVDRKNSKAKAKEAVLQMTNISLPILTTVYSAKMGSKFGKVAQAVAGTCGLLVGMVIGNKVANRINEKVFKSGSGRGIQATDFSAHFDDFCVALKQIVDNKGTHLISRFVPFALMVAGNEVGNAKGIDIMA